MNCALYVNSAKVEKRITNALLQEPVTNSALPGNVGTGLSLEADGSDTLFHGESFHAVEWATCSVATILRVLLPGP